MTRRHAATGRIVPEIVRASRAAQAASEGLSTMSPSDVSLSDVRSIRLGPITLEPIRLGAITTWAHRKSCRSVRVRLRRTGLRSWSCSHTKSHISMHVMRSEAVRTGFSNRGTLACLIEFQNASDVSSNVEAGKLVFQVSQGPAR